MQKYKVHALDSTQSKINNEHSQHENLYKKYRLCICELCLVCVLANKVDEKISKRYCQRCKDTLYTARSIN